LAPKYVFYSTLSLPARNFKLIIKLPFAYAKILACVKNVMEDGKHGFQKVLSSGLL